MMTRFIRIVIVGLSLSACGMESIPYYDPPRADLLGGISSTSFSFWHNRDNASQENFVGYRIYYRLYADKDKADSDRYAIYALANSSSPSPETVFSKMTDTYKFVPMLYLDPSSNPNDENMYESLIEVADEDLSKSTVKYTVFMFSSPVEWSLSISIGGVVTSTMEAYRSATTESPDNPFKSFESDGFISASAGDASSSGDADYYGYIASTDVWIDVERGGTSMDSLYLVIFAIGIGRDPEQFWKDTPSLPVDFNYIIQIQ